MIKGVSIGLGLVVGFGAVFLFVILAFSKAKPPKPPMVDFDFRGIRIGDRASEELLSKRDPGKRLNTVSFGKVDDGVYLELTLLDDKIEGMRFDFGRNIHQAIDVYTEKLGARPVRSGEGEYQWDTKDGPLVLSTKYENLRIESQRYTDYQLKEFRKDKDSLKSKL